MRWMVVIAMFGALAVRADVPAPSPSAIDAVLEKLKDRLYALQNGEGHWEVGPPPEKGGIAVANRYGSLVQRGGVAHQDANGGWGYVDGRQFQTGSTPGLTAAGVATLFITSEYLSSSAGTNCTPPPALPALDKGM